VSGVVGLVRAVRAVPGHAGGDRQGATKEAG
jgi:hypothetical protein